MVSYSSYDSSIIMNVPDAASTRAAMNEALNAIKSLAPDPLGLGDKRIFISEYGLFESERAAGGHDMADPDHPGNFASRGHPWLVHVGGIR